MDVRILGCHGAQFPGYNTTGFLLDGTILIDAGSVTSVLSLEEQKNIDYILVTHVHLDHVRDIMFLADNIYYRRTEYTSITVVGTQGAVDALRAHLFNNIIWPDFSVIPDPENPVIRFKLIQPGVKFQLNNFTITAVKVNHTVETLAYVIEFEGGSVIFIGDTGPTEDIWKVAQGLKNLKAIFVEASLPNKMEAVADVIGHFTPAGLGRELAKLGSLTPNIYLYHMKPQYEEIIKKEIDSIGKRNMHILSEGEVIKIG